MWPTPLVQHNCKMEMTYVFCNVIETHCLTKVVGTKRGGPCKPFIPHMLLAQTCYKKRVDLLDLSSPTCCWHKLVKTYQIVCVNDQKQLLLRARISFLGVDICSSFLLFGYFLSC
jgi:hypothetical protein